MANYTWIADSPGDWRTTANWSTDDASPTYPGAGDAAIFNGTHVGNCNVDAAITVDSVTDSGSYTGNLILSNGLAVTGASGLSYTKGTISGAGQLEVRRGCTLEGCTYSCDAGQILYYNHNQVASNTLNANGVSLKNLTITCTSSGYQNCAISGTFTISGNMLVMATPGGTPSITVNGNLTINRSGSGPAFSGGSCTVNGDIYLTDGVIYSGCVIKVDGDIIAGANWDMGPGIIEWQKAGDETWTPTPNICYPHMKFTSARTVTLGGPLYSYNLGLSAGATLVTGNYTLKFQAFDIDNMAGTFTYGTSEFNFNPSYGTNLRCDLGTGSYTTVRITGGWSGASTNFLDGAATIGTLILDTDSGGHETTIADSPTVTTEFQFLDGEFYSGTVILTGNLTIGADCDGGAGLVDWRQSGDITWTNTGNGTWTPAIKFNSNRTITLGNNLALGQVPIFAQGILDVSSNNYTVSMCDMDLSAATAANPCFNPRQGTVTLYAGNVVGMVGAGDVDGFPFYDLAIIRGTGNENYSTNSFSGYWNVAHNFSASFRGNMTMNGTLTVGGTTTIADQGDGSMCIRAGTGNTANWNLNHLTVNTVDWRSASNALLRINCTGNVDLNAATAQSANLEDYLTLTLNGSGDQTIDGDATTNIAGTLKIDKPSGTAYITSGGVYLKNVDVTDGTLEFSSGLAGKTFKFLTGKTTTVRNGAKLTFRGQSSVNMVTLRENADAGATWAIDNLAGSTVEAYYSNIKDSVCSNQYGYAYNSTNVSGNVNWQWLILSTKNIIDDPTVGPMIIDLPSIVR